MKQSRFARLPSALECTVDGQLFRGTIYKAPNWTLLVATAGQGRVAEDFYVADEIRFATYRFLGYNFTT